MLFRFANTTTNTLFTFPRRVPNGIAVETNGIITILSQLVRSITLAARFWLAIIVDAKEKLAET